MELSIEDDYVVNRDCLVKSCLDRSYDECKAFVDIFDGCAIGCVTFASRSFLLWSYCA